MMSNFMLIISRLVFVASTALIGHWLLYGGTELYRNDAYYKQPSGVHSLPAVYGCKNALLAPVCAQQQMLYNQLLLLWLPSGLLILSGVSILVLTPLSSNRQFIASNAAQRMQNLVQKWLGCLVSPRRFWMWLLGDGLTVGDLLLVLFWAAVNASWMSAILARSRPRLVARALSFGLAAPTLSMYAKMVARAFGSLLAPNLVLLFYPVSRGSVVLQALGISYPAAIRYHRWLGQAVMIFVLLHGGIYWCSFLYDKTWVYAALSQDTDINNLFGSIAFVFGLVLWITASDVVRRKWYGAFKAMHHIGFWGFLVFGCCHNWALIWNFLPGLMLYIVDGVFRIHQAVFASCSTGSTAGSTAGSGLGKDRKMASGLSGSFVQGPSFNSKHGVHHVITAEVVTKGSTTSSSPSSSSSSSLSPTCDANARGKAGGCQVLHAAVSPDGGMCSLVLKAPQFAAPSSGFVWLSALDINWLAFHPFTCVAVPWPAQRLGSKSAGSSAVAAAAVADGGFGASGSVCTAVLVHIKAYDRWSRRLVEHVAENGCAIRLKLQGPYPELQGADMGNLAPRKMPPAGHQKQSLKRNGVVVVAGGNGVTEGFSVFQELAETAHHGAVVSGLPVLLVWSCRATGELEFLAPRVLGMARALGVDLTVRLFYTGDVNKLLLPAPTGKPVDDSVTSMSANDATPSDTAKTARQTALAAAATTAVSRSPPPLAPPPPAVLLTSNDSTTAALDKPPSTTSSVRTAHDDLSSSSLCPVLALGSFGATASFKLLLHFVVVIGTFCALILLRYFTIVAPPSEPWPTSHMGPVFIAVILAFTLLPGLVLLWIGLAAQKTVCPADNSSHVLAPDAIAAPAQLASPASALIATVAAGTVGQLTLVQAAAGKLADKRPLLQLQIPSIASSIASSNVKMSGGSQYETLSVDCGRAPTRELVRSWLAPLQQQPAEVKKMLQFDVFAMGPERLVADVQLLCDDINSLRSSTSGKVLGQAPDLGSCHSVLMHFVRKTHQF